MSFVKTATLAGLVLMGWQGCARAQLAVSDVPVETATGDLDLVQAPGILAQDTLTAASVTTGGGAGLFTPVSNSQDQALFNIVQDWSIDFPGWQPLKATSTVDAIRIVHDLLNTDQAAMDFAQAQGGQDLSGIEAANANSTAVLQAIQVNTEATLAVANAVQTTNGLLTALLAVEAANHAADTSIIAQEMASRVRNFLPNAQNQPQVADAPRPHP